MLVEERPQPAPVAEHLLGFVEAFEARWCARPADPVREALTRWWALRMAGAARLDPELPRQALRQAFVVRGLRTHGSAEDGADPLAGHAAVVFEAGSGLGHRGGQAAWVVQVGDPAAHLPFAALQRARILRAQVQRRFGVPTLAVVIDLAEQRTVPQRFDGETLVLSLSELRHATGDLRWGSVRDFPGATWDDGLVRLGLLRGMAARAPEPDRPLDPFDLARRVEALGWPIRRPVGSVVPEDEPSPFHEWRARHPDRADRVRERILAHLVQLERAGLVADAHGHPRLTWAGGDVVLALLEHLDDGGAS